MLKKIILLALIAAIAYYAYMYNMPLPTIEDELADLTDEELTVVADIAAEDIVAEAEDIVAETEVIPEPFTVIQGGGYPSGGLGGIYQSELNEGFERPKAFGTLGKNRIVRRAMME